MKKALLIVAAALLVFVGMTFITPTIKVYGTTGNSGDPIFNLSLKGTTNHVYTKTFYQFNLPAIGGGTVTAATFHGHCGGSTGTNPIACSSKVSEDSSWNEGTALATMQGMTFLGAATASFNLTPGVTGDFTADVTGTTNGVKQAYADSKTKVTICIIGPASSETGTDSGSLSIGDDRADQVTLSGRLDGAFRPWLEVTYTGGGGGATRPFKVRINGQ